jgi:hypothetical protein
VGKDWLQKHKCILFIDELNLLQNVIDGDLALFLKDTFLLPSGRGYVFSSHVVSLTEKLRDFPHGLLD